MRVCFPFIILKVLKKNTLTLSFLISPIYQADILKFGFAMKIALWMKEHCVVLVSVLSTMSPAFIVLFCYKITMAIFKPEL